MILNNLFYITAKVSLHNIYFNELHKSLSLYLLSCLLIVFGCTSARYRGAVGHIVPVLAQQSKGHTALFGHYERHGTHRAVALCK